MSDTRRGADRTKRKRRQPTVGWLVSRLLRYPKESLVVIQGQGVLEGAEKNVEEVTEVEDKGKDSDYELQYVDGRRPNRKLVMIK